MNKPASAPASPPPAGLASPYGKGRGTAEGGGRDEPSPKGGFPSPPSKTKQVEDYLLEHKSISSWQAIEMFHATRLSAIIFNLRKKGYDIRSVPKESTDGYGRKLNYVEYTLIATPSPSPAGEKTSPYGRGRGTTEGGGRDEPSPKGGLPSPMVEGSNGD